MINKILNERLSPDELRALEGELIENIDEIIATAEVCDVISALERLQERTGSSAAKDAFKSYLLNEGAMAGVLINDDNINEYLKLRELSVGLGEDATDVTLAIADHRHREGDTEEARRLYSEVFCRGFDPTCEGYTESLIAFLDMRDEGACEILATILDKNGEWDEVSLDLSNTYLLLLSRLSYEDESYERYLGEATRITRRLVEEERDGTDTTPLSDTDAERNLCELLTLRLEQLVVRGDRQGAIEAYRDLTDEIGRSGCLRYYHARDRIMNELNNRK